VRAVPLLVSLLGCVGPDPGPERPPAIPERYPRCEADPDEPLTPTLADLLARAEQVRVTREQVAREVAERGPVVAPPPPSAERMAAWIGALTAVEGRRPGSDGAAAALDAAVLRLQALGARAQVEAREVPSWTGGATLRIDGAAVAAGAVAFAPAAPAGGITAPLRYVGEGTLQDFAGADLDGRIAVAELVYVRDDPDPDDLFTYGVSDPEGWLVDHPGGPVPGLRENLPGKYYMDAIPAVGTNALADVIDRAAAAGALGVLLLLRDHEDPDAVPYGPPDGTPRALPAAFVPRREAATVRDAATRGDDATLTLDADTGRTTVRDAWIVLPGASTDTIVLGGQVDAPFGGFTEDAAGAAQAAAQLEAWAALPPEDRPVTLVAALTDGHNAGADGARRLVLARSERLHTLKAWIDLGGLGAIEATFEEEGYVATGRAARTTLFVGADPPLVAAVLAGLTDAGPPTTRVRSTAGLIPPAEVAGVLVASSGARPDRALRIDCGAPFVSWAAVTPWQMDAGDTAATLDPALQARYAAGLTAIVARIGATEPWIEERP
jgi:hypothetical protein